MNPYLPMVVGPMIGFTIGVTYAEIRARIKTAKEKAKLRDRLYGAFRFNLDRITQMLGQLEVKNGRFEIPNYPFDTDLISSVMFSGRDLFSSQKEFDDLNWLRFQLVHLNNKLTFILFSPDAAGHIREFRNHLTREKKSIEDILQRYAKAV